MPVKLDTSQLSTLAFAKDYLFQVSAGPVANNISPYLVHGGTFPYTVFESYSHLSGNSVEYFPGENDVEDVDLEIYETEFNDAWDFFYKWNQSITNSNGTYNLPSGPSGFKDSILVQRVDGSGVPLFALEYTGAFPKQISEYSPKWQSSDILVFTVTFSVDNVERIIPTA